MRKLIALALLCCSLGCASGDAPDPIIVAPAPGSDPRVAEMQTQMTELLERLDVMSTRLARLEEGIAAATAAPVSAPVTAPRQTQTLSGGPGRAAASPPAAAAAEPQPQRALIGAQIAEDYRQAIMLFGRGRHADARRAFEGVFASDEAGDLADNALFWIGETYFAAGDYNNAVRFYMRVVNEYAEENKAPDALFKTALAQVRTGDLALAQRTLQQVIERYPYSSTASSAKAELQRIRF